MSRKIENISIVGAGTMGNGIAHVFALASYQVTLIDISEDNLSAAIQTISNNLDRMIKKGLLDEAGKINTLANIKTTSQLSVGVAEADLVIEAVNESLEIKQTIFRSLELNTPAHAILATNTSSIAIGSLASVTKRPEKVIGMHFMNPVPIMKLVEIINGFTTSAQTTETIVSIVESIGKTPVASADYPGFIANRILMPMINEAIFTLYEKVGGVSEIDTVMKLGMAHPMGPLELADFIGLDVCHAILKVMYEGFGNPKYFPCPLLTNMVIAGKLGRKTGEGFYLYTQGSKEIKVSDAFS